MRWLLPIHRYLGIGLGVLMLVWCLSGVVMMYVRYPALSAGERLRHLRPMDWRSCCAVGDAALTDDEAIDAFQVEMLSNRPVLRVKVAHGAWRLIDLINGQTVSSVQPTQAEAIAATYTGKMGHPSPARLDAIIDYDQWTVAGEFQAARPLYRFAIGDSEATQIYVSATNGKVVQVTTGHQRFWNTLGAIPHWLYFAALRRNVALWSQVVIWTAVAGCFLTMLGIYIGLQQWLRKPAGQWSPYRGVLLWHHLPGLIFGVLALTWVASGLVSMNPWGVLASTSGPSALQQLRGGPICGLQVKNSLRALAAVARPSDVVSVESAPLFGQLYLVENRADGARLRVSAEATSAPTRSSDWAKIVRTLSGAGTVGSADLLTSGDAYYFKNHGSQPLLPVNRIVSHDEGRTHYYLDPMTGEVLEVIDRNGQWYRWLHQGLHTIDFSDTLRSRPGWDLLMLALLSGVSLVCATGVYLGLLHLFGQRRLRGQ